MYEVIKGVISAGGYKLAEIQSKIKKFFLLGDLTDDQMQELLTLATAGVSADAERPEMLTLIQSLAGQIAALEARVQTLEGGGTNTPESTEYPAWKPWDGISKDYQPGAVVSHKGQLWESVHEGQNVWEPGAAGTESLWVIFHPAG